MVGLWPGIADSQKPTTVTFFLFFASGRGTLSNMGTSTLHNRTDRMANAAVDADEGVLKFF